MTELEQPRHADGQFGTKPHSLPTNGLTKDQSVSVEEWNADGSLMYPPPYRDYEQASAFWGSVELPDEFLSDLRHAYAESTQPMIDAKMDNWKEKWLEQYEQANPRPRKILSSSKTKDSWERDAEDAMRSEFEAEVDRLDFGNLPMQIQPSDARSLARVMAFDRYSRPFASSDDMDRFESAEITLSTGKVTAGEALERYRLHDLNHIFNEKPAADERYAQIVDVLQFQTDALADIQIRGMEEIRYQVEELRKDGWQQLDPNLKRV